MRLCYLERKLYPASRVWLTQLLPGSLSAITGLILYSAVETNGNYYYVHSIWHLLMAAAIIFLLPRTHALDLASVKSFVCRLKTSPRRNDLSDNQSSDRDNNVTLIQTSPTSSEDSSIND